MDRPRRRKLLAATIGVAAVSYVVGVACEDNSTSGNLPAQPPRDAANEQAVISGNLPAPPPPRDAGDAASDAASDADAGDAADAADGD